MKLMLMKRSLLQPHYTDSEFSFHCLNVVIFSNIFFVVVICLIEIQFRLLNAYAEEAAIEDTIYYIGEALRNDVIELEVFLKHVRQLSRRQFMLRALMQKCRQKAGLAG